MIEREILKDSKQYKPKLIGNFTSRQVVCLLIGTAVALPLGYFLNKIFVTTFAVFIAGCVAAPIYICGWAEPYGIPLEKFVVKVVKNLILCPSSRKYESEVSRRLKTPPERLPRKELKTLNKARKTDAAKYEISKF